MRGLRICRRCLPLKAFAIFIVTLETVPKKIINREAEAFALSVARDLGLDDTFLYEDPDEGWKISLYIEGCSELDYGNPDHVARALKMGHALHTSGKVSPYSFDFYDEGVKIAEILKRINYPRWAIRRAISEISLPRALAIRLSRRLRFFRFTTAVKQAMWRNVIAWRRLALSVGIGTYGRCTKRLWAILWVSGFIFGTGLQSAIPRPLKPFIKKRPGERSKASEGHAMGNRMHNKSVFSTFLARK